MHDQRLGKWDIVVVAVSAVLAVVCAVALMNEKWIASHLIKNMTVGEKIGQIKASKNDVRRRMSQSLTWFAANQEEDLFERDSLFTGPDSEVTLVLGKGDGIVVGANSLVLLRTVQNQVSLDLQLGSVSAKPKAGQTIKLFHEGRVTELTSVKSSSGLTIAKTAEGQLEIGSADGDSEVKVNGKASRLSRSEILQIDKQQTQKKVTKPIRVSNAKPHEKVYGAEPHIKILQLDGFESGRKLNLEVSRSNLFRGMHATTEVTQADVDLSVPENSGAYFYRIVDGVNKVALSPVYQIDRIREVTPVVYLPESDRRFLLPQNQLEREVHFRWEPISGQSRYHFEVSRVEDFSGAARKEEVVGSKVGLKFEAGNYYYRVRLAGLDFETNWSPIRRFAVGEEIKPLPPVATVIEPPPAPNGYASDWSMPPNSGPQKPVAVAATPDISPPKPVDVSKKVVLKFDGQVASRAPADIGKSIVNPPALKWNGGIDLSNVLVEVSAEKDFKNVKNYPVLKGNELVVRDLLPGRYFWRVKGQSGGNDLPPVISDVAEVNVVLPAPTILGGEPQNEKTKDPKKMSQPKEFLLSWEPVPMAHAYKVSVDGESKILLKTEVKINVLPGKEREFKIAAVDAKGKAIGEMATRKLAYKVDLSLASPTLKLPADNTTIVVFDQQNVDPLLFSWSEISGVAEYQIQMASDPGFNKVLKTEKVKSTKFVLKEKLTSGPIFWRVRSMHLDQSSDWSVPRKFER